MAIQNVTSGSATMVHGVTPAVAGAAPTVPDGAGFLPPPAANVDIGRAVATLMIETAFQRRALARDEHTAAQTAMVTAQREQVQHMRDQADANYRASMLDGIGKVVGGGLGVAAGAAPFIAPVIGDSMRNAVVSQMGSKENVYKGTAGIAEGSFGMFAAGEKREADQLGAQAKADEMRAEAEKKRMEGAEDDVHEAKEAVRTALDFLKEFQSTLDKTALSAASIRA